MHNVSFKVERNKLLIEVDLSPAAIKAAPVSSTGKTKLVGSTGGAQSTPIAGVTFALNVMAKP